MTKIIGLTGGIGSGKSTVAREFINLGVPVYFADDAGHEVMDYPEIITAVRDLLGDEVGNLQGKIDRKKVASIVFDDPTLLQRLNSIIHPAVKKHFEQWLMQHQSAKFIIKEAAILFESGSYQYCDKIICVVAPEQIRIQRVIHRDNVSYEAVQQRVNSQWTDQQRVEKSDFIIENTDLSDLKTQIRIVFNHLVASL